MMPEDKARLEMLRVASEAMWRALSNLGYTVGMAQGQHLGDAPGADAFRRAMTAARSALNELLPPTEKAPMEQA